jgi:predicted nucleic acid-binding protein
MSSLKRIPVVVVDSNTIVKQAWRLNTPAWQLLLHQSEHGEIRLVMPRVVLIEVVARYRQNLEEALDEERDAAQKLRRLLPGASIKDPGRSLDELVMLYEEELLETLSSHDVGLAEIPPVDMVDFVGRAALRRRPFDDNGHGFRDALVWETLLVEAGKVIHSEAILITQDGDYLAVRGQQGLHGDLLSEVSERAPLVPVRHHLRIHDYLKDAYPTGDTKLIASLAFELDRNRGHLTDGVEATFKQAFEDVVGLGLAKSADLTFHERPGIRLVGASANEEEEGGPVLVDLLCTFEVTMVIPMGADPSPGVREMRETIEVSASSLFEPATSIFGEIELDEVRERINSTVIAGTWRPMNEELLRRLAAGQVQMIDPALLEGFKQGQSFTLPPGFLDAIKKIQAYPFPPGFFDTIKLAQSFTLPPGFFDTIKLAQSFTLPPGFLDAIKKIQAYPFPPGFFDTIRQPQSFTATPEPEARETGETKGPDIPDPAEESGGEGGEGGEGGDEDEHRPDEPETPQA